MRKITRRMAGKLTIAAALLASSAAAASAETLAPLNPPQSVKVAYVPIMKFAAAYVAEGRGLFRLYPHNIFFPGICLALTVLAVNVLGDGLRDILDPRQRG